MSASNPFSSREVANRYAEGRPYHHRRTLERCLALGRATSNDGLAIDVACGTGLSTRALAELGFGVVGADLTPAMVAVAHQRERLPFVVLAAETLPVRDRSVAVVTVGSGLHWFEVSRFYEEAVRVLMPGGTLLIYEHAGVAITGDERFSAWIEGVYLSRYPSPPTPHPFLASANAPDGLTKVACESWGDIITFSRDELVAYLLTQGNVSNRIEAGEVWVEDARQWLLTETAQFFAGSSTRDFSFLVMADVFVADERPLG